MFNIKLCRASMGDTEMIWKMQREAFAGLLERYQDFETNPGAEPLDKVKNRLAQPDTYFYFICADDMPVGAIRVVDPKTAGQYKRISPLFVLPAYWNQGIAQKAIQLAEDIHGDKGWSLDTILQEAGNCHLYEKMGYRKTGETKVVNDKLTLVFYRKD